MTKKKKFVWGSELSDPSEHDTWHKASLFSEPAEIVIGCRAITDMTHGTERVSSARLPIL